VAEHGAVEPRQLAQRERLRRQREGDVRVGELAAQPVAGVRDDDAVAEGDGREGVDRVPVGVGREPRLGIAREQRDVGDVDEPKVGVGVRPRRRGQLLDVADPLDADLLAQVAGHSLVVRLVGADEPPGQRAAAAVAAVPQQRLQPLARAHDDAVDDGRGERAGGGRHRRA